MRISAHHESKLKGHARVACLAIAATVGLVAQTDDSAPSVFQPAPRGCATIHCDVGESNYARLMAPSSSNPTIIAHDTIPTGSGNPFVPASSPNQGAGCASNGRTVVCSYNNTFGDNVVAYDYSGSRLWTSGSHLNYTAFASVPMISSSGAVIAADDTSLIRFSPAGAVVWKTATPGGIPISPLVTQSGVIVLATRAGPISAFDSVDGHLLGSLFVRQDPLDLVFFDTTNTPCLVNNRVYVSMALPDDPDQTARLVAVDVDAANPIEPLRVAWHFPFGGPSYASVGCYGNTIIFDGGRLNPGDPGGPHLFAVSDNGASGSLKWALPTASFVAGSVTWDPRGGIWVQIGGASSIQRRSIQTGALIESLNVINLIGDPNPNIPYSVMTMTGSMTSPILIEGTFSRNGLSAWVIAVDLNSKALRWKINLNPSLGGDNTQGQFPIVLGPSGKPVLVFAGRTSGAYFVADP